MTTKSNSNSWRQVKLADICKINMGQSPSSSAYNKNEDGLPLIQGNNDIKNGITIGRIWTSEITKVAQKDSIILTVRAPVGAIGISQEKVCIGRGVCSINSEFQNFVFHFLKHFESKWGNLEQGSTFSAINSSDIKNLQLLLPPLPEQQKIVEVLETWDEYLEELTKMISIKRKIKLGLRQRLLSGNLRVKGFDIAWSEKRIKEFGEIVTGNTPSMANKGNYGGKYLWATAQDFNGVYIKNTTIKLSEDGRKVARFVPKGTVLVTCIASIGKNGIAHTEMAFNQQINGIIPNKSFNSEFIYYLIQNSKNTLRRASGAGAVPIISKSVFENIKLRVPPFEEQTAIAQILTTADQEIEALEKKRALIEAQKKFLLNNLVTGKIRLPEFNK